MGENIAYDNNDGYGTFFDNATSETSLLNTDRYALQQLLYIMYYNYI